MRLLPCGDRAILVEVADAAERRRLDATLRHRPLPGTVEHVPGARTVLVVASAAHHLPEIAAALRDLVLDAPEATDETDELVVEVRYDGPDLDDVATHLGITRSEVVARHTGQVWTVEFAGFAPGFAYLTGSEGDLEVPRRHSPRTRGLSVSNASGARAGVSDAVDDERRQLVSAPRLELALRQ